MRLADLSDEELLRLYCDGAGEGAAAVTQLYLRYAERLYRYFSWRGMGHQDAEDSQDEVFLRVLRDCEQFNATRGRFSQWLYGIARNVLRDFLRRRGLRVEDELLDDFPAVDPSLSEEDQRRFLALDRALDRLEPEHWAGLHLAWERGILRIGGGRPRDLAMARLRELFETCYRELEGST